MALVMVMVLWSQACWARQARFRTYEDLNTFNEKVKVFFLGAGGGEHWSNPNIWNLHEALAKVGIKSVYYASPGTAHEWLMWCRHLREFAPLLFKD
jgi:enterochelin esterase-like enzyme